MPEVTTAVAASPTTTAKENASNKPPREYNPRWKGYIFIIVTSLVCVSSVSNVATNLQKGQWAASVAFSSVNFGASLLILVADRFHFTIKNLNFAKACDGKLEGRILLFFVLISIVTVGILTTPGGLAYYASNIYFSCWLMLASTIYTLERWSSSKDIISLKELTQLSSTLTSWYALFFCSIVVFGSSICMHIYLNGRRTSETTFAIFLGIISTFISLFFILVHYKFFSEPCPSVRNGGWLELSIAFFLIVCWTIGVALLTQEQGIAATMVGTGCTPQDFNLEGFQNCTVVLQSSTDGGVTTNTTELSCSTLYAEDIPGSNLYFCVWGALIASVLIAFNWKAAQALQFAQTSAQRQATSATLKTDVEAEDDEDAI